MAEINQAGSGQKHESKVRVKRQSTRIDMTPMVDLAFLLLTFFILTSTFNDFQIMKVEMPDTHEPGRPINERNVLHLVLAGNDKIYWWIGQDPSAVTNFSKNGIRRILLDRITKNPSLMVLIKPQNKSRYDNMVDILDEMEIANMQRYAIADFTDDDNRWISENIQSAGH